MIGEFFSATLTAIRNGSMENPSISLSDPKAWQEIFSGSKSEAGIAVTHRTALTLAPVWQAVTMISGDLASMTLDCYRRLPGDNREIDSEHSAQPLVSVQVNEEVAAFEFWRKLVLHALLWGNGYAWISRPGGLLGSPEGLYNLLPDRTAPARAPKTGRLFYLTEVEGRLEPLFREEVLHVKGPSLECGVGYDLVSAARNSLGLALAAESFGSKYFAQGTHGGGTLELPLHYTEKAAKNLEASFARTYAGRENAFKIIVLRDGAKFSAVTVDAQKAQMHELREDQVRDVARFFNIPPFKLGLADSVSYNSAEMGQLVYLTGCLNHWRLAVSSECGMKLLTEIERKKTHYFEHNASNLIELDTKTLNEVLEVQRRNEVINANDWRRKINLPRRRDPGGEEYLNPNTRSAGQGGAAVESEAPGELLDVPDVRQRYPWDCGAAVTASVCGYYGVGPEGYAEYIAGVGATSRDGTAPEAIIDFLNDLGLVTTSGSGMTLDDLRKFFAAGAPVIVPCQMWGLTPEYDAEEQENQAGHYVVVIGLALGLVIVQDPVAGRVLISEEEFDRRWHDLEADGVVDDHFGVAVSDTVVMLEADAPESEEPAPESPAPEPPEEEPEDPPAEPAPADSRLPQIRQALRGLFADAVNRVARRVGFDARSAAKKPAKFLAWLDGRATEHRPVFEWAVRPVLNAVAPVAPDGFDVQAIALALDVRFFADVLGRLAPLVEPPHQQSELEANVDRQCQEFEATIAATLVPLVLPETDQ